MPLPLQAVLSGLGMAGLVRAQTLSAVELAVQAIDLALEDAGLEHAHVDGLIISKSPVQTEADGGPGLRLQHAAGLRELRQLQFIDGEGTSAIQMVQAAATAVSCGLARHVACVFADAPLRQGRKGSQAFGTIKTLEGVRGLRYSSGLFGAPSIFAMAAQRYMALHGVTREQLGAVALSARRWAQVNPRAIFRAPLSTADYLGARMIADPFGLYDCATPVDGAICVVVSARETLADLRQPPVYILGMGQGHPGQAAQRHGGAADTAGMAIAAKHAFAVAGIGAHEIQMAQFYDAFTYLTLAALEGYGFCGEGEGGAFVASGQIEPGGSLPTNTGGGHLSGFYLQGMTPLSEAIIQVRGQAGQRQCARHDTVLVTNEGGYFDHHANLVLGSANTQ